MKLFVKRLTEGASIPQYQTPGALGFDISVAENATIMPGENKAVPTGLVFATPRPGGLYIVPRSSLIKKGLTIGNNIGVIDDDYSGEEDQLYLSLSNVGRYAATVEAGQRLAQGLILPTLRPQIVEVEEVSNVSRGGFGSTGF